MRRLLALTGLAAALTATLLFLTVPDDPRAPRDRAARADPPRDGALVLYGSSLSLRATWPEEIARDLRTCGVTPLPLVNRAEAGAGSVRGAAVVAVDSTAPVAIAIVEYAINDADLLDGISLRESRARHAAMIGEIKARAPGVAVVLMTTSPVTGWQRLKRPRLAAYYAMLADLAAEADVSLFDGTARWTPTLLTGALPDGLHPDPGIEAGLYAAPLRDLIAASLGLSCP